jgi:hypothetical protein
MIFYVARNKEQNMEYYVVIPNNADIVQKFNELDEFIGNIFED